MMTKVAPPCSAHTMRGERWGSYAPSFKGDACRVVSSWKSALMTATAAVAAVVVVVQGVVSVVIDYAYDYGYGY